MVISEKKRPLERRLTERLSVNRACKVRDRRTLLFNCGSTCDVSSGGALLQVDRDRPYSPGDELQLTIAWHEESILPARGLIDAIVRRATPLDQHHQSIAVEFRQAQPAIGAHATARAAA